MKSELELLREHYDAVCRLICTLHSRYTLGYDKESYKKLIARLQDERYETFKEICRLEQESSVLVEA